MNQPRTVNSTSLEWPARPPGEVFPEIVTTIEVAQLLRYDSRPGMTPDKAARNVRLLVRDRGLPSLGRVGNGLLFNRSAVLDWLANRGRDEATELAASTDGHSA